MPSELERLLQALLRTPDSPGQQATRPVSVTYDGIDPVTETAGMVTTPSFVWGAADVRWGEVVWGN